MDWSSAYTRFDGRFTRAAFWMAMVPVMAASVISTLIAPAGAAGQSLIFMAVVYVAILLVSLAPSIKRLHDRGKSGQWLWLFLGVPLAIHAMMLSGVLSMGGGGPTGPSLVSTAVSLWMIVELGFLRGTDGPNAYGLDPLHANKPL